jgi:hypothetical protein
VWFATTLETLPESLKVCQWMIFLVAGVGVGVGDGEDERLAVEVDDNRGVDVGVGDA